MKYFKFFSTFCYFCTSERALLIYKGFRMLTLYLPQACQWAYFTGILDHDHNSVNVWVRDKIQMVSEKSQLFPFLFYSQNCKLGYLACINHSQQRVKLKEKAQLLTIWTLIGYTCVWFLSCKVTCCMIHIKICWILCSIVYTFSFMTHEHSWVSYNLLQVNCSVLLHVFLGRFGRALGLQNLKCLEKYTKTHRAKLWREWWP